MFGFGTLPALWDPWPLFSFCILDPFGPFGTLGPYFVFVHWTPLGLLGPLALKSSYLVPLWALRPSGPLARAWLVVPINVY